MSKLSEEDEKVARAAIEENERLRQMLRECANCEDANDQSSQVSLDRADSVFTLRRGNDILKGEIVDLQSQLEASSVSVAETFHKFTRLQNKRAHLRNENRSLRNITNHQAPKVREANQLTRDQVMMKKSSDERNRASKEEIKRLREIREKEMDKLHVTLRREAHLKEQLEDANLTSEASDPRTLKAAIAAQDKRIRQLEEEIQRTRVTQGNQSSYVKGSGEDDLAKLRKEHDDLREQIKGLQAFLERSTHM